MAAYAFSGASAEEAPRNAIDARTALARAPSATLSLGCLKVEMALPDRVSGFYRGTRFDWAGMITHVRIGERGIYGAWFDAIAPNIRDFVDDGTMVVAGPQTAATGPAEEFIGPKADPVPGFLEAPPGGTFIKIGVGRLRKPDDQPYSRFRGYQIVSDGRWETRHVRRGLLFRQRIAPDAAGYGYVYEKTLRLGEDGMLELSHRLLNIGRRPIRTEVYNHNFTRFDGRNTGSGLAVAFPYALSSATVPSLLAAVEGNSIRYLSTLAAGDHVNLSATGFSSDPRTSGFTISAPDGVSVNVTGDVAITRSQLWSVRRVVAVEPFVAIDLQPGAEKRWTWRYRYAASGETRCGQASRKLIVTIKKYSF